MLFVHNLLYGGIPPELLLAVQLTVLETVASLAVLAVARRYTARVKRRYNVKSLSSVASKLGAPTWWFSATTLAVLGVGLGLASAGVWIGATEVAHRHVTSVPGLGAPLWGGMIGVAVWSVVRRNAPSLNDALLVFATGVGTGLAFIAVVAYWRDLIAFVAIAVVVAGLAILILYAFRRLFSLWARRDIPLAPATLVATTSITGTIALVVAAAWIGAGGSRPPDWLAAAAAPFAVLIARIMFEAANTARAELTRLEQGLPPSSVSHPLVGEYVTTAFEVTGHLPARSPLILVFPGRAEADAAKFTPMQQHLAQLLGGKVISLDLPGITHGTLAPGPVIPQIVDFILAAIAQFGVGERPHIVAHSTGAYAVLSLLANDPDAPVGRTVLIGPAGIAQAGWLEQLARPSVQRLLRLVIEGPTWLRLRALRMGWRGNAESLAAVEVLVRDRAELRRLVGAIGTGLIRELVTPVELESIPGDRVTVLVGDKDALFPPHLVHRELRRRAPAVTFQVMPGPHSFFVDSPEETARRIAAALQ